MAYCIEVKIFLSNFESDPSTLRPYSAATSAGFAELTLDDHALADGAEITRFVRQGETIEINA